MPDRCQINPSSIPDRLQIDPKSIPNRFQIDSKSINNRPNSVSEALLDPLGPFLGAKLAPRSIVGRLLGPFWGRFGVNFRSTSGIFSNRFFDRFLVECRSILKVIFEGCLDQKHDRCEKGRPLKNLCCPKGVCCFSRFEV